MFLNFCPFTLALLAAPGTDGCVSIPSHGRAVAVPAPNPATPAEAAASGVSGAETGWATVPVTSYRAPVAVAGLPDSPGPRGVIVIVPAQVASAMRELGMKRPYRIASPQLLLGQHPNQYAPGLIEHTDLFAE